MAEFSSGDWFFIVFILLVIHGVMQLISIARRRSGLFARCSVLRRLQFQQG